MHITREADYAIRMVHFIAGKSEIVDAQSIANAADVSLNFALKILRKLVAQGVITSFKGVKGGYILAKSADEISILEVIEAVSGTYVFNRCLLEGFECPRNEDGTCPYHKVFCDVTHSVKGQLQSKTFGEVLHAAQQSKSQA